jgi:hypothetical protein
LTACKRSSDFPNFTTGGAKVAGGTPRQIDFYCKERINDIAFPSQARSLYSSTHLRRPIGAGKESLMFTWLYRLSQVTSTRHRLISSWCMWWRSWRDDTGEASLISS